MFHQKCINIFTFFWSNPQKSQYTLQNIYVFLKNDAKS